MKDNKTMLVHLKENICPICGRRFIVQDVDSYVYKSKKPQRKVFCSWGCLRKYEKEHPTIQKFKMEI